MSDAIVRKALSSLGKWFDLTSDFRLKYCKGDDRLVVLNETDTTDLHVPRFEAFNGVSVFKKSKREKDGEKRESEELKITLLWLMMNLRGRGRGWWWDRDMFKR